MKAQHVRLAVLFLVLAFMSYLGYRHQLYGSGPEGSPPVDAMCPFGGLEGLYGYAGDGSWITRLAPSSLVLFVAVVVVSLVLGRVFCGWMCPMGAVAEFARVIAGKLGIRARALPERTDAVLRYVKYILLAVILAVTWRYGYLFFRDFDPWMAWMHLTSGEYADMILPLAVLGTLIVSGVFVERAWCRYLCPLGACFGVTQKFSLTRVHRDSHTCIDCGECDAVCPAGLKPSRCAVLTDADCIACGKCVEVCEAPGHPLTMRFRGGGMTPMRVGIFGVAASLAICGVAAAAGYWSTQAPVKGVFTAESITGDLKVHDLGVATGLGGRKAKEIAGLPSSYPGDKPIGDLGDDMVRQVRERIGQWLKENPPSGE